MANNTSWQLQGRNGGFHKRERGGTSARRGGTCVVGFGVELLEFGGVVAEFFEAGEDVLRGTIEVCRVDGWLLLLLVVVVMGLWA